LILKVPGVHPAEIPMRAILRTGFGGPEVLEIREIPEPEPKARHAVIEVKAFGINHAEMHMRKGEWAEIADVSGIECAGLIKSCPGWELDVRLSPPGSSGTGTNPGQLFAAGWSTWFLSSIKSEAGKAKVKLPADMVIDAEVDLGMTGGAYPLAARLNVSLPGIDRQVAQDLVDAPTSCAVIRTPHAATLFIGQAISNCRGICPKKSFKIAGAFLAVRP
jgi:organic hydroperoxide reductase OsmC/OhrA